MQRDEDDAQLALGFISPDRAVTVDIARATDGVRAGRYRPFALDLLPSA